jgi:uncharacterized protein (DUF2236 family)
MTSAEQHKMVQRLKQVMKKMSPNERQSFEMMAKRDKDDEDLDTLTMAKLEQLYMKFFPKHSKEDLEDKWKKIMGEN